jgi:hypothetical protein
VPNDKQQLDKALHSKTAAGIALSVAISELHLAQHNKGLPVFTTLK